MVWLQENFASILVGLVLLIVVAAVVVRMVRDKKAGKSGCGCGCEGCAKHSFCHPQRHT